MWMRTVISVATINANKKLALAGDYNLIPKRRIAACAH